MFVAEHFLSNIVDEHGQHPVSKDGGTWSPRPVSFLEIKHHIQSSYEKSIVERTIQYIKDRTAECFDDYFPRRKKKCKLKHVQQWLNLFTDYYNNEIIS